MDIKRQRRKFKQDGFTLAELLVVVAIIGILVAVSIPIFTSQLEKARLATCLANRRSLLAEVRVKALDSDLDQEDAFNALYPADKAEYPCPKGGVFSWKDGQIICSVHDGTGEDSSSTITVGSQKIKITATIKKNYQFGEAAYFKPGEIYKIDDDYYVIISRFTTNNVKKENNEQYSQWFARNLLDQSYPYAVRINTSSITTITDESVNPKAGDLYISNKNVYVIYGIHYLSSKTDLSGMPQFGISH